jgi:hypothetical protein
MSYNEHNISGRYFYSNSLPMLTIAIFPLVSTSAQTMTGNMTSSNTILGATVENMTDRLGLSIGYHLGIISLNNNGSLILSRSPVKYPCAPPSQTVLGKEPDPVTLAITSSGEASGNSALYSAAAPAT